MSTETLGHSSLSISIVRILLFSRSFAFCKKKIRKGIKWSVKAVLYYNLVGVFLEQHQSDTLNWLTSLDSNGSSYHSNVYLWKIDRPYKEIS